MTVIADHNIEVVRVAAETAAERLPDKPGQAWLHGLSVGILLAIESPNTARELRMALETIVGRGCNIPPELVESANRNIAALFDRSADT